MSHMRFWKVAVQIAGFLVFIACFASPSSAAPGCTVQVTPTAGIFGPEDLGKTTPSQTFTFTEITGVPCQVTSVSLGGTDPDDFSEAGNGTIPCPAAIPVAPGGCTVGVSFRPLATGTRTATLTFTYTSDGITFANISVNLVGGDTILYVSNQDGGQVLKVDGGTGYFAVLQPSNGFLAHSSPEGMTIGPDSKLYIADPARSQILRMNQDGTQGELVYSQANFDSGTVPTAPQGPSFSSSSTGDLYLNTESSSTGGSGVFEIPGVGSTPYGSLGTILSTPPTNIVPGTGACPTSGCFIPDIGAGTAFDSFDDLMFVEAGARDDLFSVSPPYTGGNNPTVVSSGFTQPTGVALNKATGQMFVADTGTQQILAIGSDNTRTPYFTFSTSTAYCPASDSTVPDLPVFMQFDGTGHLFVVTTTSTTPFFGCGKVWRIDPTSPPVATLLVNLSAAYALNNNGLLSRQAIGLALQTSGTQSQPQSPAGGVSPTGGSFTLGWPVGCVPAVDGSAGTCSITYGLTYGNNMFQTGDIVKAILTETSQADWGKRTTGNGFASSHLAEVLGYGGDGFIISVSCTTSANVPCTFPPNNYYTTTSAWKSPDPVGNWCTFGAGQNNPQLLKADPIGSDNWIGILIGCEDKGPIHIGGSGPSLSDHANVKGATGTSPTITITTPANGANYNQNSIVDANYSCTPTPPVIAGDCFGGPDLVHGTTTVQNNTPIDTSTLGLHSFQVAADVNSGPGGSVQVVPPPGGFTHVLFPVTVTYTVVPSAQVSATPANVHFGTFHVPGFGFQFVTVKNIGAAPLSISSVKVTSVSGKDSDDFFALSLCPKTLGAGKSCFILLGFFADEVTANNPQMANLVITATGGSVVVPLSATVVKR
jgi:sugar lactone lactonase YvrE